MPLKLKVNMKYTLELLRQLLKNTLRASRATTAKLRRLQDTVKSNLEKAYSMPVAIALIIRADKM